MSDFKFTTVNVITIQVMLVQCITFIIVTIMPFLGDIFAFIRVIIAFRVNLIHSFKIKIKELRTVVVMIITSFIIIQFNGQELIRKDKRNIHLIQGRFVVI